MKRTVSALYQNRDQAERVVQALKSAGLGEDVDICDQEGSSSGGLHREEGHHGWLSKLFGGHRDTHVYGEALRRGHVLVSAKVDEFQETRAAEILDTTALDVNERESAWTAEGWRAPPMAPSGGVATGAGDQVSAPPVRPQGAGDRTAIDLDPNATVRSYSPTTRTRSYVVTDPVTYSKP